MAQPAGVDIRWTSERSLRVSAPGLCAADAQLFMGVAGVLDVVPTESAIYLTIDPASGLGPKDIAGLLRDREKRPPYDPRMHEIPVCYEAPFAPDLAEVARHAGVSEHEVVRVHTSTSFTVSFIGFAPGFGYLTGWPEALRVPRLPSPRVRVEAGSVGLAGPYSGVYALPGPGGWRIIGRTNAVMFGVERPSPALLRAGDLVRFRAISSGELGL